ncbi:flagellar hook-length control protein FliK [Pseudomonas sp. Teo4]|uniref:flagellar hook-length control protein FliK n=1 Tax=Pseudomonas sp. Teo4 TaxID=3064528 RepID=UPI002ABB0593|nr:flagellar hook-length control protein FliK [Pseudomonas sp. Teo4]MDZ3995136.1 hypothetical protein [Pseudomonas sp. Teo4]
MNIITNLTAQPLASSQDVTDTSSTSDTANAFSTALEQAETASTDAPATPITTATPSTRPASTPTLPAQSQPVKASEAPQLAVQAEAADLQQELPQVVAPEPLPPAADLQVAEVDANADEAVDMDSLAAMLDTDDTVEDSTDADDGTEPSRDSLEAIRQRLDLIDNAGVLAISAPVSWAQAPAANPEPSPDSEPSYEGKVSAPLEWSAPEEESPAAQPDLAVDSLAEIAPVATRASLETTRGIAFDSPPADTADGTSAVPTVVPGLSSTTTASASTVSTDTTAAATPSLGSTAWQDDLGQQVIALVRRGEQQMDMQLNPADLGPLSISLNVSEGGIQAQFQSTHASVRSAVEQALPQLQVALAAQGLTLGEASVNDGASRQAMGEQPRRESPGASNTTRTEPTSEPAAAPQTQQVASLGAGVDLYL